MTVLAQFSYNRPRREHRLVIIQGDIYVAAIVGCADLVADGRIILLPGGVATGIGYFRTRLAGARYAHSGAVVSLAGCPPGDRAGGVKSADRKSTRLNSSHVAISYAVFCLKKKTRAR